MDAGRLPRISVVVPSRGQVHFLARALDSLAAQQYPDLQVIVVDAASSDGTLDLLRERADVVTDWVSEPDRGQTHALNKGFALARGRVRGWLNCDERYRPGALRLVGRAFAEDPRLDMVFGHRLVVDEQGRELDLMRLPAVHPRRFVLYASGLLFSDTTFWTAELHEACGSLDQVLCPRYGMDFEWLGRLALKTRRWRRLDAYLSEFTEHSGRVSADVPEMPRITRDLRRHLQRQAGVGPARVMLLAPLCFLLVRVGRHGWRGLLRPPSPLSMLRVAGLIT
jgi:glycosyltransferase involved in cell wall biosynthesis